MNKNSTIKQISISFEEKDLDQRIASFIKSKKQSVGISDYIKSLVRKDMNTEHNTQY